MPPGTWHEVYTPVKGICSGGHFLCYNALHLTAISRLFDRHHSGASTNDNHPSIHRTLSRMLVQFCRKPKLGAQNSRLFPRLAPLTPRNHIDVTFKALYALFQMVMERDEYRDQQEREEGAHGVREAAEPDIQLAGALARVFMATKENEVPPFTETVLFAYGSGCMDPGRAVPQHYIDRLTNVLQHSVLLSPGDHEAKSVEDVIRGIMCPNDLF